MLSDLDGQRRQLEASRDKLHQADENLGTAMQVMKRMKNRCDIRFYPLSCVTYVCSGRLLPDSCALNLGFCFICLNSGRK